MRSVRTIQNRRITLAMWTTPERGEPGSFMAGKVILLEGLRIYRGETVSKGRRAIRRQRYSIRPGTQLLFNEAKVFSKGVYQGGKGVVLSNGRDVSIKKVTVICYPDGWQRVI